MDEKAAAEAATSTQKSLLSCHDPGWNDPPKWAFSPGQSTGVSTPTKRLLNKRVAFPLSSSSPSSTSSNDRPPADTSLPGNLPPPSVQALPLTTAPHAPLLAPKPLQRSTNDTPAIDKEQALNEASENLEAVINDELESGDKKEEVRRRLEAMKIMWKENKLTDAVYEKVLGISKALRNNDVEAADKIHVSLMMDDAALCNTWISGIRHIILELREKLSRARLTSLDRDDGPYFLPGSVKNDEDK